jgi:hypothetical protein
MKMFLFTLLATVVANTAPLNGIRQLNCYAGHPSSFDYMSVKFEMYDTCLRCHQPRTETRIALSGPFSTRIETVVHNYYQKFGTDLTGHTKSFISYENLHPLFPKQISVIYNGQLPIKMNFKNKILPLNCNFNHKEEIFGIHQCKVSPQNDCSKSPKRLCCYCISGRLECN